MTIDEETQILENERIRLAKECKEIENRLYTNYFSGETRIDDVGQEYIHNAKIRMNKSIYEVIRLKVDIRNDIKVVSINLYNEDRNYLNIVLPLEQFEQLFIKNSLF